MKVAALQMVSTPGVEENLAAARRLLAGAAAGGAELAVLPEYFCVMGRTESDKLALREAAGVGPIQQFLAASAKEFGLWIAGGTLPIATADANRVRNTTFVYSPSGECVAQYDKIHLFRFDNGRESYDESRVIESGSAPVTFDLPARDGRTWRVGLSICYDLRFPELYRAHAAAGADLLLVPSAFTHTTGSAHWEVLLRARAVENLCYVLAAAQGGTHLNGRRTWGHSMLVDPWGQVLAQKDEGEGMADGVLDAGRIAQCRMQLRALDHRVV
ncbi:MAG: carbon-nitrogen hydrolase family protein [Burkholderiaceae bacterium]